MFSKKIGFCFEMQYEIEVMIKDTVKLFHLTPQSWRKGKGLVA